MWTEAIGAGMGNGMMGGLWDGKGVFQTFFERCLEFLEGDSFGEKKNCREKKTSWGC